MSGIPAEEVAGCSCLLDDEAIYAHTGAIKVSFFVDHLLSSNHDRDDITAASVSSEAGEEQERGHGEQDIEKVWNVSELSRSSEHSTSVLKRVKVLCESL